MRLGSLKPRCLSTSSAALFGLLGSFAVRIGFETSPEIWFPPSDPSLAAYRVLTDRFGGDRFVLAVFEDRDEGVFSNRALGVVDRLTRALEDAPHVRQVQSLTTYEWVHGADGVLEAEDLIDESALPLPAAERERARELVLGDPLAAGLLVDDDARATAVVALMEPGRVELEEVAETVEAVRASAGAIAAESGYAIHLTGAPVIDHTMFHSSTQDNLVLMPTLYGFIALVLFLVVRRPGPVGSTLLLIALVSVWLVGLIVLAGSALNNLTAMLPMILLAVAVANAVHVLVAFERALPGAEGDRPRAVRRALVATFRPCFFSSFTTALGFASLTISDMPPLAAFGLLAAIGVLLAFGASMTFLPAALSLGRPRPGVVGGRRLPAILEALRLLSSRRPRAVVATGVVVTALALASASRIEVENVAIEFLRSDNPTRVATEAAQDAIGGVGNLELVLEAEGPDGVKDPAFLARVAALQEQVQRLPEISKTVSLVDLVRRLHRVLEDDDPRFERIPDSREAVAQLLLLYEMADPDQDLDDLVNADFSSMRIFGRMGVVSAERTEEIVAHLRAFRDRELEGIGAEATGIAILYNAMGVLVFRTFVASFVLALIVITLTIALSLRSVSMGLLSMIPNVLPIVWVLGVMGATGIPLNIGTALVAGITLGIAVDDTIHFLARYSDARRAGLELPAAVEYVFDHSGAAIVTTSVILMGGFWTLIFAQFLPVAYLGLISGITIAFALTADLLLLPALLHLAHRARSAPTD